MQIENIKIVLNKTKMERSRPKMDEPSNNINPERNKPLSFKDSVEWASKKKDAISNRKYLFWIVLMGFFLTLLIIWVIFYLTNKNKGKTSSRTKDKNRGNGDSHRRERESRSRGYESESSRYNYESDNYRSRRTPIHQSRNTPRHTPRHAPRNGRNQRDYPMLDSMNSKHRSIYPDSGSEYMNPGYSRKSSRSSKGCDGPLMIDPLPPN